MYDMQVLLQNTVNSMFSRQTYLENGSLRFAFRVFVRMDASSRAKINQYSPVKFHLIRSPVGFLDFR